MRPTLRGGPPPVLELITKLFGNGDEDYEIQNLNESELGELIKVTVEYSGGLGAQLTGDDAPALSVSAVARREAQ